VDDWQSTFTGELAALPGVLAVALGGSRARGEHRPDSDWDFAIYYRGHFDPNVLRVKGWEGQVFDVGGWGGGVMNGGAWLRIDGRKVDVHYRDLDEVEYWTAEASEGRFRKELLSFYVAGIPTYVVTAELALGRVLSGELPSPEYSDALSQSAEQRWHADAVATLAYAQAALGRHQDVTVAMANAARGLLEEAHSRASAAKRWVLNEKRLVETSGLADAAFLLLQAQTVDELGDAITEVTHREGL
jgi:predicted nucleotidyltransferase